MSSRVLLRIFLLLVLAAPAGATVFVAGRRAVDARAQQRMAEAANRFLEGLDEPRRAKARFAFEDEERFDFNFVPLDRRGLTLGEMTPAQRRDAHDLMRSALSTQGYLKATHIMQLETVLRQLENQSPRRDPEKYYFSVFGEPGAGRPWGWRLEGHHLSLNFSAVTPELVATTPAFMGSNPAEIRQGPYTGLRVLGAEEDLGRALLLSLDAGQRRAAVIDTAAPREIVTGNNRRVTLERPAGLPAARMTPEQRALLVRIVEESVHNLHPELAEAQMAKIREAGIEALHFAWAGSPRRDEGHYYRVHGPTVLFEYDNTQNDNNHVHTVWRDLADDFGEDLLRRHYRTAPESHDHR